MNYSDFNNYDNLPKEAYEIAESNGIPKRLARQRYEYGWDAERAITEPNDMRKKVTDRIDRLHRQAAENGNAMKRYTVMYRLQAGFTEKEIIETPVGVSRKTRNELFNLAAENGIKKVTYKARRQRGWTPEEAATIPVKKQFRHKGSWSNEVLFGGNKT